MNSGTYIIEGGGFSVTGNASVSGSGVLIVNAGSKYPTTGGTYGGITLSGNGSYNLTPLATGTYAGIVIFQTRDNSKALSSERQRLGNDRHDLRAGRPACREPEWVAQCGDHRRHDDGQRQWSGQRAHPRCTLRHGRIHARTDPCRLRHQQSFTRWHGPDHCHRRCLRRPEHLPGPGRVRLPVRADALRTDAVRSSTERRRRS